MKPLKSKSSVILLLVVATVVWGIILYRLFALSGDKQVAVTTKEGTRAMPRKQADSLLLDYRDPFGIPSPREKVIVSRTFRKETIPKEPEAAPSFRYAGKIRRGNRDFLLIVDGEETHLISAREKIISGFRIEKIYTDSLWVCKGRKRYTVRM